MNARARLLLSLGIPLLVIVVVLGAFLWQRRATGSSATGTPHPVSGSECSSLKRTAAQPLAPLSLALDWTPNTNHTGIYVALNQGWYRAEGIDLKLLPYAASVTPDVLVSTGKADVGVGFTEGIVADAAVGQPVVSIAAIIQHNTSELVTLASSGLTRPLDLDGKVYGGFGAPYEVPVVGAVIKHDGGKGTFKNVTLNVDAMQALQSHRIDFVWVYQGWEVIQAERSGLKLNIFPITRYGVPDYYTPNLIASPSEIQHRGALLRRFMTATACGYEYARTHPQQAAQMLLDGARGAFPDPGLVFASQAYLSPRYADAGRKWGMQDAAAWHDYPRFIMADNGVDDATGKPVHSLNLDALYTNQFLS